jgi:hypothetical protein
MEYLFLIALAWWIREFEPIQYVLIWLRPKFKGETSDYLLNAFDCIKCLTFWSALAVTWSFEKAVIASFLAFSLELIYEIWSRKK